MKITLPDGSTRHYDQSVTAAQIAADIGPGLARAAVGAKINGQLVDLNRPISADAELTILTRPKADKNGVSQNTDPDALFLLRHSCAHVLAEAICRLWPQTLLAYGPPVENGFYYDICLENPISSDDFLRIEAEMCKIIEADRPFTRFELSPAEGLAKLEKEANKYKLDNAQRALAAGSKNLTWYVTGSQLFHLDTGSVASNEFQDLCMGPHLPSTALIGAFKILSVATSHWHGDVHGDRFQRIYGTAFFTQADLEAHLEALELARKRDHRVIGQRLGLFTIDEQVGQGLILWKPQGAMVRSILEGFLQNELLRRGYKVVYTPHIGKIDLYKTSGHYPFYQDSQYPPIVMRDGSADKEPDQYLLKPMNCPHHIKIYSSEKHSYRDLPIRLAEFGTVYRFEQSGELTGMTRVRGFTQDDAHIFCTAEQVKDEICSTVQLTQFVFATFGFEDVHIRLGLRAPDSTKYTGDPAHWDRAERELREILVELEVPHTEEPGEAAFYGPKIDFVVRDVIGRNWQLGTVQLDYNLPERFGLTYVGSDNAEHQPVMIHRAPFGSMERFMAILIEHFDGAFPLWLAPEQARILPVSDKFVDYARTVHAAIVDAGFRVVLDESNERLGAKIKVAQDDKVPYMLVVGGKDKAAGTVSVRCRTRGDLGAVPLKKFIDQARRQVESRSAIADPV